MKLKILTLANFRGFDQIDLEFEGNLTVIAGVNGVGKSGVLKALATLLSHALPKFCICLEKPISLIATDIQLNKTALTISCSVELKGADLRASIVRSASIGLELANQLREKRDQLRKDIRYTTKRSKEALNIEDQIKQIELRLADPADVSTVTLFPSGAVGVDEYTLQSAAAKAQPIAVLYSTNRLSSRIGPRLPPASDVYLSSAYSNALSQPEVSLYEFAAWFRAVSDGAIQEPALSRELLQLVESTLKKLLPEMSELQLHTEGQPQFSLKKGDKRLYLWQLSDGEQGLVALALDLLRRLAIANPFVENPVATGSAVVLIDEIELHLHPKWQRDVLQRLRDTFNACQFVVTTHSPLVLGEVPARCVRFLEFVDGKVCVTVPTEAYGMDANRILQEFMGAPVRNRQVDAELKTLFELIDQEYFDKARTAIAALEVKLGEGEPELTRASSLIRFLEGIE